MIKAFQNAFKIPELRQRLIFTGLMLIVYRLGAHITLPGIDDIELEKFFEGLRGRTGGSVIDFVDLFSGGAFSADDNLCTRYPAIYQCVDCHAAPYRRYPPFLKSSLKNRTDEKKLPSIHAMPLLSLVQFREL